MAGLTKEVAARIRAKYPKATYVRTLCFAQTESLYCEKL